MDPVSDSDEVVTGSQNVRDVLAHVGVIICNENAGTLSLLAGVARGL